MLNALFGLKKTSLTSNLNKAFANYHVQQIKAQRARFLSWIELDVMDGIEALVSIDGNSPAVPAYKRMMELFQDAGLGDSSALQAELQQRYKEAEAIAFPASIAFTAHAQALSSWTRNFSLVQIDPMRLRALDIAAHRDLTFKSYVSKICDRIGDAVNAPNTRAYAQVFELYSEALVFEFLRSKVKTARIDEIKGVQTPDFHCELESGKQFFVEVKSLDVVDGDLRQDAMSVDAIDQAVDLHEQLASGKSIATSEGEIAPYKKAGETSTYDPRSLIRVIDILREKMVKAFKSGGQFAKGPTFGLAVVDRLGLVAGRQDLVPYYADEDMPGACGSGVLWHAAYGRPGTPIFRRPDFEGAPNLEGHLATHGALVDVGRPFAGVGLIVLERKEGDHAWGLQHKHAPQGDWQTDDTTEALAAICEGFNDEVNALIGWNMPEVSDRAS
ncbi:hypothetical protein GGD66_008144 [Bradyrhizobium sp. CIR48]|uniref:hypothetical protein n=1 Tax=unclassified Bradyrhizobium TaxID=2631580 RepID=UPI0016067095|nr:MULTISPECIES: hypothetical protein [unclassified Bradyrhizobium]MBB4360628.1 hypothetical protein [Bradyrhizobium sp. CIR18]MBB4429540.1 hypothetical protein [Bradyrhizobium sp. CIR48]